ncbi:homeobox domain-containing protein [Rhodocollybia butyracea]|uniref:Homeobox domain-containing protein n=1 Tax=Rhodocollybia butyracea TaxID=206335 RepID=A0A9P5Q5I1_9AGAR|nr:homeobox domain-containing protein [Rhodocollybia butyracea]
MPPAGHLSAGQKKPRTRHSQAQIKALNELYERDEHPALDLRTQLAERLGMETKTVNSWFQNKRASSKKRTLTRSPAHYDNTINPSTSSCVPAELDELDEEYLPAELSSRSLSSNEHHKDASPAFYPALDNTQEDQDSMNRRSRIRPSADQVEQLKKLFNANPLPSTEEKQALADHIGMRYQSITTWFQNQRSILKKRHEGDSDFTAASEYSFETRKYSAFPPPTHHPSLNLPPASSHPSLPAMPVRGRRSLSPDSSVSSRRTNRRRSATPYESLSTRPRRTRPEPYQLDALKDLYLKTAHPSIEERTALALQVGMDLGKVTNWFRNLRQTTRKRAKKAGSDDDDDMEDDADYHERDAYYNDPSRSGSPTSSMWTNDDLVMYDEKAPLHSGSVSDAGSDDEYEEAVTPSSVSSRSPPPPLTRSPVSQMNLNNLTLAALESATVAEMDKISPKNGIKVEDALLLLTFHQQVVQ